MAKLVQKVSLSLLMLSLTFSLQAQVDGADRQKLKDNAERINEGLNRCENYVNAWLKLADSKTGLIPRNTRDKYWNAQDSAADNYPFMVLTSAFTDRARFDGRMLNMLNTEIKLTSRIDSLPDTYDFKTQAFRTEKARLSSIMFGSSEYIKDGLLPLTEWLGNSPWSQRMITILDDMWKHAPIETPYGKIVSKNIEVNGEMLQALSRVYWMTGEQKYLDWAIRLGDYYLLGNNHPTRNLHHLRLRDHGCEVVSGLCELYAAANYARPDKKAQYQKPIHQMLDRILEVGRNKHGLLYNTINPVKGTPVGHGIADTWGYNFNGFYTVYLIDGTEAYRQATLKAMKSLNEHYRNYQWEGNSSDGYADSIESALNLYNREPVPSVEKWLDSEIKVMWGKQKADGVIEGWHGDGNFARTTIMYSLWKSQGVTVQPWRSDLRYSAIKKGENIYVYLKADKPWSGKLIFDRQRHKSVMKMPMDWPRINQFPEWFTADEGRSYKLSIGNDSVIKTGKQLIGGVDVSLTDQSKIIKVSASLEKQSSNGQLVKEAKVALRSVAEREGDFAWENDLTAFRVYGPKLKDRIEGSGIDCFMKHPSKPALNKVYYEYYHKKKSYHQNRGDAYDNYKVGSSRGCGGTALWKNGRMYPADTFDSYKVIKTTIDSGVFELIYNWDVDGDKLKEVKRISVIPGTRLFRVDSTFTVNGKARPLEIAVGLARQQGKGELTFNKAEGWLSCWSPIDNKAFGTGIKLNPDRVVRMLEKKKEHDDFADHGLVIARTDNAGKLTYYAGFGWEDSGVRDRKRWDSYLAGFNGFELNVETAVNEEDRLCRTVCYELFYRPRWYCGSFGIHYAEAGTVLGLLSFAAQKQDYGLIDAVEKRYQSYVNNDDKRVQPTIEHCDILPQGTMLLRLYLLTGKERYLKRGMEIAETGWQRLGAHGMTHMVRWWVDDMYMLPVVQVEAYKATGSRKYLDRAAELIDEYNKKLQREDGLYSHGDASKGYIYPWSRGNGWASAGMAEVLAELPASHPRYTSILKSYRKMMAGLLKHQAPSGLWHQVIDVPESYEETSGTGMFAFGMAMGVKYGWLDNTLYKPAVDKAWKALCSKVNAKGLIADVCVGTNKSKSLDHYLKRPTYTGDVHGQAAFLWLANVMLQLKEMER